MSKILNLTSSLLIMAGGTAVGVYAAEENANSGEKPTAYAVSNAHLDTQWNWDVQTTISNHIRNTINQNLFLLSHYPDYIFNFEGGVKYAWMKEYYPREFEMVKDYIRKGRWHVSGASWDANDVIVPSVESQIRNIMLGQNFYRNELGVESTDIFLPDCFGFGYTLPTIAAHCGLIGFSSQKLGWRQNDFYPSGRIPFPIGLWQGVDGSRIMMVHGYDYNTRFDGSDLSLNKELLNRALNSSLGKTFRYYGTGDIGGSPTMASVESVEKALAGEGPLKVISAESDRLYRDYLPYENHPELPVFDGELLMDVHGTGCYTSQAAMKHYNRSNEQLGYAAECAATAAALLAGSPYPGNQLTEAWRRMIWHQFHDDLTGTSIPRAYEFSWNDELLTLKQFGNLLSDAAERVAATLDTRVKGVPVVLFNPLGHKVTQIVEFSVPASRLPEKAVVKDHEGKEVKSQVVGYSDGKATLLVEATLPAAGFAVYDVSLQGNGKEFKQQNVEKAENSLYAMVFNRAGDIISLTDKRMGRKLVKDGSSIGLAIFPDNRSDSWPSWEIMKSTLDTDPLRLSDPAEISMIERGPLRTTIKVIRGYGDSKIEQYIRLYEGELADRIDFDNVIDWASPHTLLKAEFPLTIADKEATYDLGVGTIRRGNNVPTAYEVPAQQWADLTDASGDYGMTVVNNSKYGWDKPDDNTLRLTLLHTPGTRRNYRHQNMQDLGHHEFSYSIIGHEGALRQEEASRDAAAINQPVKAFVTDRHAGKGRSYWLAGTDASNVDIKALKRAEDGAGYVVRVYETAGQPAEALLSFALPVKSAAIADGTEKILSKLQPTDGKLPVSLKKNGIGTYRVWFDLPAEERVDMASVAIPYNTASMTYNDFRTTGDFAGGYSYAAELVPDTLRSAGVDFVLNPGIHENVLLCSGDTIQLPAGKWNKLHLLVAAAGEDDLQGDFKVGKENVSLSVPSYTGFVGQWGHTGHTEPLFKPERVAYTGTHRHSAQGDEPYEYTYMFHQTVDIPRGATTLIVPDNQNIALFAATVSNDEGYSFEAAAPLFNTLIVESPAKKGGKEDVLVRRNILRPEMLIGCSGYVVDSERPEYLIDGDATTKWCDVAGIPSTVDFDLGEEKTLTGWRIVNAGRENPGYITSGCYLMGRNSLNEDWHTLDALAGNRRNVVERKFEAPQSVRYLRLMVTTPTQDPTSNDTRIYELEVY